MPNSSLRIAFAGTPDFAASHLAFLIEQGYNIVAVYTQPDRPAGRGKQTLPTPVKQVALQHDIPVFQPPALDQSTLAQMATLDLDVLVVVAYGQILNEEILHSPRLGCINVHASLLPRWRGAAPVERAILSGDKETGISIMQMDTGLDTGDVLLLSSTPITGSDNAASLSERLLQLGCQGLSEVLSDLPAYQGKAQKQDPAQVTYASKLAKEEALVNWSLTAEQIQHQVQAFYPRSPAFCYYQGERLRIISAVKQTCSHQEQPGVILKLDKEALQVACGQDVLEISILQLPGKKPTTLPDLLNGHPDFFKAGASLSSSGD